MVREETKIAQRETAAMKQPPAHSLARGA
jgi:hypothetical protein